MSQPTTMTINGLKIQRDESGQGHRWANVSADSTEGGVAVEIEAWVMEERPDAGETYTATNGITYRAM